MASRWPKIIRDPIHDIISFENDDCDKLLLRLIDAKEFQRLRRIKQLGMCDLVFPGASHSRFSHSVGVLHTARKFLDRVEKVNGDTLDENKRLVVLAAALLHDLGHGPLSHSFEEVTDQKHEERSTVIILDESTDINGVLKTHSEALPRQVAVFLDQDLDENPEEIVGLPSFFFRIVSGQLDADRFDYLLRDSHFTGTQYGSFDIGWLLQQLRVESGKGRFYLSRKAFSATEEYVFARYHMYKAVYFHKACRAAEKMVTLVFQRFRELLAGRDGEAEKKNVVRDAPSLVVSFFSGDTRLSTFLGLDDHAVTEFLKAAQDATDSLLKDLARGLLHRKLYKCSDVTGTDDGRRRNFDQETQEWLRQQGLDAGYLFLFDTPGDTPYEPYDPDEEEERTQIYIETPDGRQAEISRCSKPVEQLTSKYQLLRYYYPEWIRDNINEIAQQHLRKEES